MKTQKANSHEGITWSEMAKQNVQAKEVYSAVTKLNDTGVNVYPTELSLGQKLSQASTCTC